MAGVLDKFIQIIEENDLGSEDIKKVKAQPHPLAQFRHAQENKLTTPDEYTMNPRYLLACAVHRINPSHWQDPDVKKDPSIQKFMENLDLSIIVDEEDFAKAKLEDPRAYQMRIEVVAKGKTFKKKAFHPKGGWWSDELRNTDEELVKKFINNASRILSLDKASRAAKTIFELEKLGDITELMETISI